MMKPAAALSLTLKDQVKFGKETLTVIGSIDVGTHKEPLLQSESGKKYFGTLFIAHLLTRLGGPEDKQDEDEPAFSREDATPEDEPGVSDEENRHLSAQPAEAVTVAEIEESPSVLLITDDDESNIPEDERELVKAYTLNELL